MNIHKKFQLAFKHYEAGNLQESVSICKEILRRKPREIAVLHFLGIVYQQLKDYDVAIKYLQTALQLDQNSSEGLYNLGRAFENNGEPERAVDCYQKVIKLNPKCVDAFLNLGNIFHLQGNLDRAISFYQEAIALNQSDAGHFNLGVALEEKGRLDEAILCFRKVLQSNPDSFDANFNIGYILNKKKQFDEAITYFRKALKNNPNHIDLLNNLGAALRETGQVDDAIACFQRAISLNPRCEKSYHNLGAAYHYSGELDAAIKYYKKALEINPNLDDARWNMSHALLLSGNFKDGWKEYEYRWKTVGIKNKRNFTQPVWDGQDIKGKVVLLHAEQGFGDTIQFIRYAPMVSLNGAKILVECPNILKSLLQNIKGVNKTIARDESLPYFDIHCPLLRLPLIFHTTGETIPANIPYIAANSFLVQKWKAKIQNDNSKKIGVVWAGSPTHTNDRNRSCSLQIFSPLAAFHDVIFFSLQKGEASKQAKNPPEGMKILDYTEKINDFSDTAALIENLDIVISVDTAVAHLGGAMGKPVWTLLPFAPDWRWMSNREDSPWYPTMRLFRQPAPGDWESVIAKVKDELLKLLSSN